MIIKTYIIFVIKQKWIKKYTNRWFDDNYEIAYVNDL